MVKQSRITRSARNSNTHIEVRNYTVHDGGIFVATQAGENEYQSRDFGDVSDPSMTPVNIGHQYLRFKAAVSEGASGHHLRGSPSVEALHQFEDAAAVPRATLHASAAIVLPYCDNRCVSP